MKLFLYTVYLLIVVYGNELSLYKVSEEDAIEIVYQISTRKSLCFPTEELMGVFDNDVNSHNWGYLMDVFNYTGAVRRVGQVLCRQLGFSVLESIMPVPIQNNYSQHILWAASCLGYEPLLSHCFYQEMEDTSHPCQNLIGLKCVNCHKKFVLKLNEPQEVFSPGFPVSYPDNTVCEWRFSVGSFENFKDIIVKLEHLSLPRKNHEGNCANGYLGISGYSRHNQFCLKEKIICGSSTYKEFSLNCSVVIFRWNAGLFHPRPHLGTPWGFKLKIEATSTELIVDSNLRSFNMSVGNVVGIFIGVLSILIVVVSGVFGCRFMIRKRAETLSRQTMAERIDSRRNHTSSCGTIHPNPKLQLANNSNTKICNIVSTLDGNIPRTSISSGVYDEWNEEFTLNRSFNKEAYLMLEEALRRSTLSPKQFGSDKFQFPIPVVKITAASENLNVLKDSHSSTSDVSSFTGSVGSNNVFCEDASFQREHQYNNADTVRKSTYTLVKNIPSSGTDSENIEKQNFECSQYQQNVEFSNERKSSAVEKSDFLGSNVFKTLSRRFSTGHVSDC